MKTRLIILSILLLGKTLLAVNDSTYQNRKILKLNFTQLIFSEADFYFEYFKKANSSIEGGIGIIMPAKHYANDFFFMPYNENIFYYQGIMLSVQYKFYNKRGMYISPLIKSRFLYYNNVWVTRRGEGMTYWYESLEDSRKQTHTLELLFGIQSKNKFNADFYFGFGLRFISMNIDMKDYTGNYLAGSGGGGYLMPTFHLGVKFGLDISKSKFNK